MSWPRLLVCLAVLGACQSSSVKTLRWSWELSAPANTSPNSSVAVIPLPLHPARDPLDVSLADAGPLKSPQRAVDDGARESPTR